MRPRLSCPSFQTQLQQLKAFSAAFSHAYPSLAPLLSGPSADPDVERTLDGVAFLKDLLEQSLIASRPDFTRTLVQHLLPHYPRPLPACTMLEFSKPKSQGRIVTVPAGSLLASMPVDGTPCLFRTTEDLDVHPLELQEAALQNGSGRAGEIVLSLQLHGLTLAEWQPRRLRLFLAGDRASATELFLLLCVHARQITLCADETNSIALPPTCLRPVGYAEEEALFPYPPNAFAGFRLLQEYFHLPEKFLAFDLAGWENWTSRGTGTDFRIRIQLDDLPFAPSRIARGSFALNTVPAINLFAHDADPVYVDHRTHTYRLRPSGSRPEHRPIHSVDRVTGLCPATGRERHYAPFHLFGENEKPVPSYHVYPELSPSGQDCHTCLNLAYPAETPFPEGEILSLEVTCSNGRLPESLRLGDIHRPGTGLPPAVAGRNITAIQPGVLPPLGPGMLWHLTTHLYLNEMPMGCEDNVATLLRLYIFDGKANTAATAANLKRIEGLEEIVIFNSADRQDGQSVRGSEIHFKARLDHFSGPGDLYLFGCILERFFARYSAINDFTRLMVRDLWKGGRYPWPLRQE